MQVTYDDITDLLYFRIDPEKQDVRNERIEEDVVLDIGKDEKIVGIEIMNAKERIKLKELFPIQTLQRPITR